MKKATAKLEKVEVAPSPFLPGTQIQFAWDSTSLGYLKTCPRLYYYQMIEGWSSKEESIHLRFGIEYHQALQDYDDWKAQGEDHNTATQNAILALLKRTYGWEVDTSERPGDLKNRKSLVMAVVWYLEKYRVDAAQTFILDNGKPATELSFKFELDWGPKLSSYGKDKTRLPYTLCGHLDRVVTYSDELMVMDRKTTTMSLTNFYASQFEPNNQMSLYSFAAKVVLDTHVKGVIIDAVQLYGANSKTEAGANFQRFITYRTPGQVEEWIGDLRYHLTMAEGYAQASYWPMNDTACDKFGGCKFRRICSKDPGVRKQFLKTYFTQLSIEDRWNPLKPR